MLLLFNTSSGWFFVSLSFNKSYFVTRGALDCPFEVAITNDRTVLAWRIYRNCVLDIFGVRFPIDLIHILMGDVCVIVGIH